MKYRFYTTLGFALVLTLGISPAFSQGIFENTADWGTTGTYKVEGSVNVTGSGDSAVYELEGNGNDIWGTADEGFFVYAEKTGSWSLTSHVTWIEPGGNDWAKLGPMVRADADAANSANYFVLLRGAMDTISAQWRPAAGSASSSTRHFDADGNEVPASENNDIWIRIIRVETDLFLSEWSRDGENWNFGQTLMLDMPETAAWGLAITNHDDNEVLALGDADNVAFEENPEFHPVAKRSYSGDINLVEGSLFVKDGTEFDVNLEVLTYSEEDVTVIETLSDGWTASEVSNGGTVDGNTVTWNISAAEGSTELSYHVTVEGSGSISGDVDGYDTAQNVSIAYIAPGVREFDGGQIDIGAVGAPGESSYDEGFEAYVVRGSGGDIWGGSDQFHYLFKEVSGPFEMEAFVFAYNDTSTNEWSKVGIMARENLSPGSPNFFPLVRGSDGQFRVQERFTQGGASTGSGLVGTDVQMGEMRIVRRGDTFQGYYRDVNTGEWVLNRTDTIPMENPIYVGMAVTSHNNPNHSVGEFEEVQLTLLPFDISRSVSETLLNPGDSADVSVNLEIREGETPDVTVTQNYPTNMTVSNLEASAGEPTDDGNGTITWTLSGATGKPTLNFTLISADDASGTADLTGSFDDGESFSGDLNPVTFAFYNFQPDIDPFAGNMDISSPGAAGTVGRDGDQWAVIGSGADIWGQDDQFHYLYLKTEGDFKMTIEDAFIGGVSDSPSNNFWQKMGVMARDELVNNTAMAIAGLRAGDQAFMMQWREAPDTDAAWDEDASLTLAEEHTGTISLAREGDTFIASFLDADGNEVVNNQHDIVMEDPIYVGIAVTSHSAGDLSIGSFSNVNFEGSVVPVRSWMLY